MNILLIHDSDNLRKAIDIESFLSGQSFQVKKYLLQFKDDSVNNLFKKISDADVAVILFKEFANLEFGFLISYCLQNFKPGIFVCDLNTISVLKNFSNLNEELFFVNVSDEKMLKNINEILRNKAEEKPFRFNFFLSPKLAHYLDWVSKNKKISRSVYLRQLIDKEASRETK